MRRVLNDLLVFTTDTTAPISRAEQQKLVTTANVNVEVGCLALYFVTVAKPFDDLCWIRPGLINDFDWWLGCAIDN